MAAAFSREEIIKIAIGIETRGITFYDIMAKSSDSDEVRAVFQDLADMERNHLQTFLEMLESVTKSNTGQPSAERRGYLETLIDTAVFSDDLITSDEALQADSDVKALELAINAEKDSILFYYEIKDELPESLSRTLNRIIAEEKLHLRKLSEMKKDIIPQR